MSTYAARGSEQANPEAQASPVRPVALVELIATIALALSTLIAVTAVSIGIARADVFGAHADATTEPLAIALFVGLLLSAMGCCLTAAVSDGRGRS